MANFPLTDTLIYIFSKISICMHLFYTASPASVGQNILITYWLLHDKVLRKNTSFQISPTFLALEIFNDRVNQINHSDNSF